MPAQGISNVNSKLGRLAKMLASTVPKRIAADAERHFKESFRNQGFTDAHLVKWRKTKKGKPNRILKGKGLLMNSIRVERATWDSIRVVAGGQHVPYALIHNEGGTTQRQVTRRAHFRKAHMARRRGRKVEVGESNVRRHQARMNVHLPKRQFMGRSRALVVKMRATILRSIAEVAHS